jgi:hypothetical protein
MTVNHGGLGLYWERVSDERVIDTCIIRRG